MSTIHPAPNRGGQTQDSVNVFVKQPEGGAEIPIVVSSDQHLANALSPEEEAINNFDTDQRPPDILMCELHARAQQIGRKQKIDTEPIQGKLPLACPCCGEQIDTEPLAFCDKTLELGYYGSGIPLYFEYISFSVLFLTTIAAGSGVYAVVTNYRAGICEEENADDSCHRDFYNLYATSAKIGMPIDESYALVNLSVSILLMILCVWFRRRQNLVDRDVDVDNITPADFTVWVKNLPKNSKKEQVQEFFNKELSKLPTFVEAGGVPITKMVFAYNIEEYVALQRQMDELEELKSKYIMDAESEKDKPDKHAKIAAKIDDIDNQLEQLKKKIDKYEEDAQKFEQCGVCFVSFQREEYAQACVEHFKRTFWSSLKEKLPCIEDRRMGGNVISVVRAPEPSDIYWQNLSVPAHVLFGRRMVTNMLSLLLLGIGLVSIFFISYAQQQLGGGSSNNNNNNNSNSDSSSTSSNGSSSSNNSSQGSSSIVGQIVSIAMSIVVQIVNYLLKLAVRALADYERHPTHTQFESSLAEKLGLAQFVNTAVVQLLVCAYFFGTEFQETGGLNQSVTWTAIVSAATLFVTDILDPLYLYRMYQRRRIRLRREETLAMTQMQAHAVFEGPAPEISSQYAALVRLMLFCVLYAYELPLVTYFGLFGILAFYGSSKYLLLRRYKQPRALSSQLSRDLTDSFLELLIFTFSISCVVFEKLIFDTNSPWTYVQVALASAYLLADVESLCSCVTEVEEINTSQPYEEVYLQFDDDYDRSNPITHDDALDDWFDKIDERNGVPEEERKQKREQRVRERNEIQRYNKAAGGPRPGTSAGVGKRPGTNAMMRPISRARDAARAPSQQRARRGDVQVKAHNAQRENVDVLLQEIDSANSHDGIPGRTGREVVITTTNGMLVMPAIASNDGLGGDVASGFGSGIGSKNALNVVQPANAPREPAAKPSVRGQRQEQKLNAQAVAATNKQQQGGGRESKGESVMEMANAEDEDANLSPHLKNLRNTADTKQNASGKKK